MKKLAEDLKVGDNLKLIWVGQNKTIKAFHEYKGTLDFILKTAVFLDGAKMSLEKGRYYECEE